MGFKKEKIVLLTCHFSLLVSLLIHPQEAPASRLKRTVDESKTSCLLYLYADHLYYKRFKSVEAVVAQVTSFILVSLHDISCDICDSCFENELS